jgi:hypothetical protein
MAEVRILKHSLWVHLENYPYGFVGFPLSHALPKKQIGRSVGEGRTFRRQRPPYRTHVVASQ